MARKSPAQILKHVQRVISAWKAIAPRKVFYGMTLAQFQKAVRPSLRTRTEIENLQLRLRRVIDRRKAADVRTLRFLQGVVSGVKGDPEHGSDGSLYASMGYVRNSVRGKRRRKK